MPVDDLWYLKRSGSDGKRRRSQGYGRGKRWRVRWVDPDTGERRSALFERKVDAELHDVNMQADISQGRYIDPRAGRVTVADYAEGWRSIQLHRDSTQDMVERALRIHILPVLGRHAIADVRASHVQHWVKRACEVLAASTVHLVFTYVKSMFAAAVIDRLIGTTPCVGIRLPDIERPTYFIPSAARVHAVSVEIAERYAPVPYLAAGCGLRASEVFGLELDDIDFAKREIHVRQQLKRMTGEPPYLGELKTRTSYRSVEMPAVVHAALRHHLDRYPPREVCVDDRTDPRRPRHRQASLLFVTATGLPLRRSNWSAVWRRAVRRAELPAGFGLHGLRHYFATLLIHNGASVKTVQLALGHSTPTITLNTYAHEWPDALDRTRAVVDDALGQAPNGPTDSD